MKNFVSTTPQGLLLDYFIYQGASTPTENPEAELGIGRTEANSKKYNFFVFVFFTFCQFFDS